MRTDRGRSVKKGNWNAAGLLAEGAGLLKIAAGELVRLTSSARERPGWPIQIGRWRKPARNEPMERHWLDWRCLGVDGIKRDETAARQAWLLNQHLGLREKQLRLIDVREMFVEMKDQI